ncbi:MAG: excisionase family DNA-binding protein [Bifidobacteriaceae bacterium]|nr:excisionase family DNA-binding protein [Bifidobacteriaceae bacterium]
MSVGADQGDGVVDAAAGLRGVGDPVAPAAEAANVSRMTIQRRIEDGTIKAVRRGSRWRVPQSELDRYRRQVWRPIAGSGPDGIARET